MNRFIFTLFLILVLVSPLHAWQSKSVKKANDFISAGMPNEAIQILESGIQEKPKDHEAHWILGQLYLEQGAYSSADKRFSSAIKLKPAYKSKLGNIYKNTANLALTTGRANQAVILFEKALQYGRYDKSFYIKAGDRLNGMPAAKAYQKAAKYSELREEAGKKILYLAVKEKYSKDIYKKMGAAILGQDFVDQVFPGKKIVTVFEKTYTWDDAYNEEGSIETIEFGKVDLKIGDTIYVVGKLIGEDIFSGEEIYVWAQKKWNKTSLGKTTHPVQVIPKPGTFFCISLYGRKDVQATVIVKRKVNSKPNVQLLELNSPE